MWYFSWILGLGLALAFGVLNAIWYEVMEDPPPEQRREDRSSPQPPQPQS
ncbi:MAG: cytochrome bd-I oxidase subunit CydX [Gammaproteobacteria bacterium]|nr:MAG: cytochrome bd-I oxidase subunit CydX [Gammaproteobacteria bacterium]TLY86161.1 MAG: cytochrome bd-I oxidase subunit CydX [Gammaproteobacteria bacterium]